MRIVNTIYQIDESSWDAVAGGHPQLSHAWQRVLEASVRSYRPDYVLLFQDSDLAAFAICSPAQSWQLGNPAARRLLNWSTLLGSVPSSTFYTGLAVRERDHDAGALDALLDALRDASRQRHRILNAVTNVNPLLAPSVEQLAARGFWARPLMDGAFLPIRWTAFEDYGKSLGGRHYQEVRTFQRKAREMGVTVTHSRNFVEGRERLYELLVNVHRRHYGPGKPHYLKSEFFEALERERPPGTELILVRQGEQIVAFSLCQAGSGLLTIGPTLGLDYERARKTYAYFLIYYANIRAAMDYGCRGVYAGLGTYEIKGRLGFERVPRHLCVRVV